MCRSEIKNTRQIRPWIRFHGLLLFLVAHDILETSKIYFVRWCFTLFNPDVPIQTASDDVLGRHSFAEQLARAMISYNSPEAFTIGLYGPWGSGKTSVINLLEEELNEQSNDCIVVRFNPWLCSTPDQMISQFFEQLKSDVRMLESKQGTPEAMRNFVEVSKNICEAVGKYADALKWARVIPGLNALGTIFEALGTGTEIYQKIVGDADTPKSLQDHKNRIHRILEEQKQKIIVIIDDLDRLSSDEIVAVFQLVKSLADFPYMIYLLAFDRDIVVKALADVQKGDGQAYLEKIVQMPFELPQASDWDIQQIFYGRLKRILPDFPNGSRENVHFIELFQEGIQPFISCIRDITRYFNTFSLKYAMLRDEIDSLDLIAVTCLQVFQPKVYTQLPFYKDDLCGDMTSWPGVRENESRREKIVYDELMRNVLDNKELATEYLLKSLFPRLTLNLRNIMTPRRYNSAQDRFFHHSISAKECFDRYFTLSLEKDALPAGRIRYMIVEADQESFKQDIYSALEHQKIDRLLREIRAYCTKKINDEDSFSGDRAKELIQWLAIVWDSIKKEKRVNLMEIPRGWQLNWIVNNLLDWIDVGERYGVLKDIFKNSDINLSTISELLSNFERQHKRFGFEESNQVSPKLELQDLLELEKIFAKRVLTALDSAALFDEEHVFSIVYMVEKIVESDSILQVKMQEIIDKHMQNDVFLSEFVAAHTLDDDNTPGAQKSEVERIQMFLNIDITAQQLECYLRSAEANQLGVLWRRKVAVFLMEVKLRKNNTDGPITENMIDKELNDLMVH